MDEPPSLQAAEAPVFPQRGRGAQSPPPPPEGARPQTPGPTGAGRVPATGTPTVWFTVPGDYLEKCGLCGLSLAMLRLCVPRAHAPQDVVVAHDDTSAQFYHLGCTTGVRFDADVRVVTLRLADPVRLHRCANEACVRTLPREAPAGYVGPAQLTQEPVRKWNICAPRGLATVEIAADGDVAVYHPECFGGTPRLMFSGARVAATATEARAAVERFVRDEWFGSSARTQVHVLALDREPLALVHDAAGRAYPTCLVIEEALADVGAVPPRHARRMRASEGDAATPRRAVPWSFERFVLQALSSPAHAVAEVHVPSALIGARKQHWNARTPSAAVEISELPRAPEDAATERTRFRLRHSAFLPRLEDWLAYVRDVVATSAAAHAARGTAPPVHPLRGATLRAVSAHLHVDAVDTAAGCRVVYGLDAHVRAGRVYLTSGAYSVGAAAWVPMGAVAAQTQS